MNPFLERREFLARLQQRRKARSKAVTNRSPDNLFVSCPDCNYSATQHSCTAALRTCPQCGHHFSITAYHRLKLLLDSGSFEELNTNLVGGNPLSFPQYDDKTSSLRSSTGLQEAVVTAKGRIDGAKVIVCVMDSRFLMGSMGGAVGEKITRAFEYATKRRRPIIIFSASGGARMQEGIVSLMQMAKTSAAAQRHGDAGLLYISVLTHPTTGGVTASFASLGDIILAEPGALIGFAGPRVIEQTIGQKLPEGFQRAEYLQEHGFVDAIVPRSEMKHTLATLLHMHR